MNELVIYGNKPNSLLNLEKKEELWWIPQYCHFYYIFDLHLDWKIAEKEKVEKDFDWKSYIEKSVLKLKRSINSYIKNQKSFDKFWVLIGGDITCDIDQLDEFFSEYCKGEIGETLKKRTIFVPGNHELWSSNKKLDEVLLLLENIVVKKHGIYLLNNAVIFCDRHFYYNMFPKAQNKKDGELIELGRDIFYKSSRDMWKRGKEQDKFINNFTLPTILTYREILDASDERIMELANTYSETILCGIGFSGYNDEYNATTGLYRGTIRTIEEDLACSHQFEEVYKKLNRVLRKNTVICFTHTQKENWSKDPYNPNWIYVNGHTHKNVIFVDDKKQVYSDNQLGYQSENYEVKFFTKQYNTNPFRYYEDGIYENVSVFEYMEFYRSFGESCTFKKHKEHSIIMMKKHGIYMFMAKSNKDNKLFILSGGVKAKCNYDVKYYYDRMINYYTTVNNKLLPINSVLQEVSEYVKRIGGEGRIHGFIVDIDFFSHLYVDFLEQQIIPYFAYSMTHKAIYQSIPQLLEAHNQDIYNNYLAIETKGNLVKKETINQLPKYEENTDLYSPSRKLLNYQKMLKFKVIRSWNNDFEIEPDELPVPLIDHQ